MKVEPYLDLNGRCEEAIEFYKRTVGAQVEMMMRYKEAPEPPPPGMVAPGSENKILHASLRIGDSVVMMSDGYCGGTPELKGVSLAISVPDEATAERVFTALAEGGQVHMPLGKTFFSPKFGMAGDRFGVGWMVVTNP